MSPKKSNHSRAAHHNGEKQKLKLKKEIGLRIRQLRKMQGYTQAEMVEYFDCGRANYSRIEKGEVFPNPTILKTLNSRFNVSLHWLICNKGSMLEQEEQPNAVDWGGNGIEEEIKELLSYMDRVPMVKHAMLGYFLEYKAKYKRLIEPMIEESGKEEPLDGIGA